MSTASRSIFIVHNKYVTRGGEEKIVDLQQQLLTERGHSVETYFEDSAQFQSQSAVRKVSSAATMSFSISHYNKIRRRLRARRPSIVHVHNIFPLITPAVYFAARAERIPVVQSLHNYRWLCSNGLFLLPNGTICERCKHGDHWNAVRFGCYSGSRLRSAGMAATLSVHRALGTFADKIDAYITPSSFLKKKYIEAGFPEQKMMTLSPGLPDLPLHTVEQEPKTVLFVGRLSREKGLPTLLAAARLRPDWTFKIAGDGVLKNDLMNQITSGGLTNVQLLGRLSGETLERAYQQATFLILPSECYENLPTVILEAWFYGTPVIVSRLGGMAELVKDGELGFQFPAGDAAALAQLLSTLSLEKSLSMKSAIQQHFKSRYAPARFVDGLIGIYEKILSNAS